MTDKELKENWPHLPPCATVEEWLDQQIAAFAPHPIRLCDRENNHLGFFTDRHGAIVAMEAHNKKLSDLADGICDGSY